MKKPVIILIALVLGSLLFLIFSPEDNTEPTPTEETANLEPDSGTSIQRMTVTKQTSFINSSWKKVRKSINSITNSAPTATKKENDLPPEQNSIVENSFSSNRYPLTNSEIQSVQHMTKALSRAIAKNLTSHQFMQMVKDSLRLRPQFLDEGTSSVGSLVTVRTHDALEGTRYLHAQFTGEQNKADFLQHASFQIRPGPDSFHKAVEALNEVLPKDRKIKESSDGQIIYSTNDGYIAWIKVADMDDLKSNDYNKASTKDIGTVIVTIEQEIHGDEEHSH